MKRNINTHLLVAILLLLLMLVVLVVYSIQVRKQQIQSNYNTIQALLKTESANNVRFNKIQSYQTQLQIQINKKIQLPKIIPGPPGIPGIPGLNGKNGKNGVNGKTVEIRCNPQLLENEWRYTDEKFWHPLDKVQECAND